MISSSHTVLTSTYSFGANLALQPDMNYYGSISTACLNKLAKTCIAHVAMVFYWKHFLKLLVTARVCREVLCAKVSMKVDAIRKIVIKETELQSLIPMMM